MKCSIIIFAAFAAVVTAEIEPSGICPLHYSPICASNGITYGNECFFNHAASLDDTITFLFRGTCEYSNWDEIVCRNSEYSGEVCGFDGVVYENECFFNFAVKRNPGLAKRHDGPCEEGRAKRHIPMVCGSDGRIYDAPTFLREKRRNPELYEKPMSYCSRQPPITGEPIGPQ